MQGTKISAARVKVASTPTEYLGICNGASCLVGGGDTRAASRQCAVAKPTARDVVHVSGDRNGWIEPPTLCFAVCLFCSYMLKWNGPVSAVSGLFAGRMQDKSRSEYDSFYSDGQRDKVVYPGGVSIKLQILLARFWNFAMAHHALSALRHTFARKLCVFYLFKNKIFILNI